MTQLTMHAFRRSLKRAAPREHSVPDIGTVIDVNVHGIQFSRTPGAERTPMAKAKYDSASKSWRQVSVAEAGLMLFYDREPAETHTKARVIRTIPNGRACYVEPM